MITPTLAEIVDEATAVLEGLEVTVTSDPAEAAGAVAYGGTALLALASPRIEWETLSRRSCTWTLWTLTGASSDPLEAVQALEPMLDRLAPALGIDSAEPQSYDIGDRSFPGYTLTLTTEHA